LQSPIGKSEIIELTIVHFEAVALKEQVV